MNKLIKAIHDILTQRKLTIATAESCTGGLLSFMLTSVPGSSKYFKLGLTVYSNTSKQRLLKIPAAIINKQGAVSGETAKRMAQSVKKIAKTDIGVGITGIAGPGGGTIQKPAGTVYIAVVRDNKIICSKFLFKGTRAKIKEQSALKALELIKKQNK